jgi:hypothetical protein
MEQVMMFEATTLEKLEKKVNKGIRKISSQQITSRQSSFIIHKGKVKYFTTIWYRPQRRKAKA